MSDFLEGGAFSAVEEYLDDPLAIELPRISLTSPSAKSLADIISGSRLVPHALWRRIRQARDTLMAEGDFEYFPLKLEFSLRVRAYMKDGGGIYFSLGALIFRSSAVTLAVLCHELAHLWLSRQDFYPKLKEMQRAFKARLAGVAEREILSPIELYAMRASLDILTPVADSLGEGRAKRKLLSLIEAEREKILTIADKLKKYK